MLVIPFPAFDPVLIDIGPLQIRWYALAYIAGIFLGWWAAKRLTARPDLWGPSGSPLSPLDIDDVVVWITLGIVLGGRLGYVAVYDPARFAAHPLDILAVWEGGMSFHGGFVGTVVALVLFARRRRLPLWSLIDVIATVVPYGLFFGRLANFVNGELWGRPSFAPWAMIFPNAGPPIPRHPSQLYEAALEGIALFLLMRFLAFGPPKALSRPGMISGAFAAFYALARIFVEQFREPDAQIGFLPGGLTMGMALSIPMLLLGLGLVARALTRQGPAVAPTDRGQ
ncbi:MAG: prolipoprotein diacylglyceryl transferase [Bauldia sp.]